jgi:hypothetical protein
MRYSNIPKKLIVLESLIGHEEHPNGYAWVTITSTDPPKDPYPYVSGWILAEEGIIDSVGDFNWFKLEIKDLLEGKFTPNPNIEYLVEFIWDKGDSSVGIFPGYNCHLVLDEDEDIVIRTYFEEGSENDPRCFIDNNSRTCFIRDLDSESYQINQKTNFIEILKTDSLGKYVNEVYVIYPSIEKLNHRLAKLA